MTRGEGDEAAFTDAVVDSLAQTLIESAPSAGSTRVMAIDGRSGAGKSSLAALVALRSGAQVISLEYLYGGWHDLEGGVTRMVRHLLEPIAHGTTAVVPQYDWVSGKWGDDVALEAPSLLIVEGVGAYASVAAELIGTGVWLEAPAAIRRARANARDGGAFASWWDVWSEQESAHLAANRTPDRADVTLLTG